MQERAAELRKEADRPRGGKQAAEELEAMEKIAAMPEPDRRLAERVHALVTTHAPDLAPKLWYGQPAYARKGKVVCFFRSGQADGERYSTFGLTQHAVLDDARGLWPTAYALVDMTSEAEEVLADIIARVG